MTAPRERGELARAVEKAMLDVPVSSMSDPELEAFERASSALADYCDAADAVAYMGRPQDRAAYDAARARLLAALSGQARTEGD